ncbi:hypothetical protein D0Z07_7245 [Hyphodiscus hymeniophilus]|uniref:Uncharacterized protein n=1 Tax=Hyphodiscus hymeniophilus TaxID=353542 RepID=A0A9P6VG31_9HELO|nr:hypothetical protein D0Z07_7245 [Hyphodiscus hymeniophilus]
MTTPTLIDMPDPPSNPDTPTEAPGTPNSTTTSLSALSTTAIKDGHRGSVLPHTGHSHHHTLSSNTLEAERADRISRLAGLERVSTARPPNLNAVGPAAGAPVAGQIPGYFDANGNPVYTTKMSTVGSASATGSVAGTGRTTTWASGSTKGQTEADDDEREADQMSMDANYRDSDRFSASAMDEDLDGDGMSDDTSLVGFGEGAGSTVSGPTYSRSNLVPRPSLLQQTSGTGTPLSASSTAAAEQQRREARIIDGLAADEPGSGYMDTAARGGMGIPPTRGSGEGVQAAERIMQNRLDDGEGRKPPLGSPDEAGLGKFYFEKK